MFSGYKTYLVAALAGLLTAAKTLGYIDEQMYQTILGFLASVGLATLRNAIK